MLGARCWDTVLSKMGSFLPRGAHMPAENTDRYKPMDVLFSVLFSTDRRETEVYRRRRGHFSHFADEEAGIQRG